mgnify:CR=1 FL=1
MLKESQADMSQRMLQLERQLVDRTKERDAHEAENFRLRREMVGHSISNSERSAAFASFQPGTPSGGASRVATAGGSRASSRNESRAPSRAQTAGRLLDGLEFAHGNTDYGDGAYTDSVSALTRTGSMGYLPPGSAGGASRSRSSVSPMATPGQRPNTRSTFDTTRVARTQSPVYRDRHSLSSSNPNNLSYNGPRPGNTDLRPNTGGTIPSGLAARRGLEKSLSVNSSHSGSHSDTNKDQGGVPYPMRANSPTRTSSPGGSIGMGLGPEASELTEMASIEEQMGGTGQGLGNGRANEIESPQGSPIGPDSAMMGMISSPMAGSGLSPVRAARGQNGNSNGKKKKKIHQSHRAKTSFVGSGLGLRQEPVPSYGSGGGAKAVLARILQESMG